MSFTLYNYVLSGNCYKVRLMASLLDVTYESVSIDFHPGLEHKAEAMLRLNPAGTLPVLITCDGVVLTETQAMLVWLAQTYDKSKQWWPVGCDAQTTSIMQWLGVSSTLTATVGELRLHSLINKPINVNATRAGSIKALRILESHLAEQRINGRLYLTGDKPTIADIACFPYAALCPDAGIEHDDFPAIRRWLHALRSLDKFVTMPGIYELHELRKPAGGSAG